MVDDRGGLEQQEAKRIVGTSPNALILYERREDLITYKQDKAKKWMERDRGITLKDRPGTVGARGSAEAFREGVKDGQNTNVSNQRRRKIES